MANVAVHEFKVEVSHTGLSVSKAELIGVTNIGISIDGNREDWTTLGSEGWKSNLVTGKGLTVSLEAKADLTNEVHKKLINDVAFGKSANHNGWEFTITFPKTVDSATAAASLTFTGSINPSDILGGESTDVSSISLEVMANNKPTYVAETTK